MTTKTMKNMELRVFKGTIQLKDIADHLNIHPNTMSRWFNDGEMDDVRKAIVQKAIEELQAERK